MRNFVKDRDEAFTEAVVNDNWAEVKSYSKRFGIPLPKNQKVMKAGVFKAVQYCTSIPEDVKMLAMQKCLEMGFNPYIEGLGVIETKKGE